MPQRPASTRGIENPRSQEGKDSLGEGGDSKSREILGVKEDEEDKDHKRFIWDQTMIEMAEEKRKEPGDCRTQ